MWKVISVAVLVMAASVLLPAERAGAGHSWNTYHWARTTNPFTLKVVNSLTPDWDTIGSAVVSDWSASTVLDLQNEPGSDATGERKRCKAVNGKVRACDAAYGYNGWLGLATIWLYNGHIVQGTSKVNDSYFSLATYNNPNAKRHVLCQEVGHTFGLGHQTGDSCMDDVNGLFDPNFVDPNQHDYDQLVAIYGSHTDSSNSFVSTAFLGTAKGGASGSDDEPEDALPPGAGRKDGKVFERDLGGGRRIVTFVWWVHPGLPGAR